MKKCRVCKIELTENNWMPSLKLRNSAICKECNNEKGREWRFKNRDKANKYSLDRYFKNPKKSQLITNKSRIKVRLDMIVAYGGVCCQCLINDVDVLDIDHIDNTGAIDRKKNLHGYNLYRALKKAGWPKDNFQLLCKNCNWKKHLANIRKGSFSDIQSNQTVGAV
jgi:hypothetical protein